MKFGFMTRKPIEEYFDYVVDNKLNHVEIDLGREHSRLETFNSKRVAKITSWAAKKKISLSLHTPYTLNPSNEVLMIRNANINYIKKCILLGKKLKITHMTAHIGFFDKKREPALERLVDSLKQVLLYCKQCKIRLTLENDLAVKGESEIYYLGDRVSDFEFIFSKIKSPYLKLCLDIGHANTGDGAIAFIQRFGNKIANVHFHDNKGKLDNHLDIGEGTVRWTKVMAEFKRIGYKGIFISETVGAAPHESKQALLSVKNLMS